MQSLPAYKARRMAQEGTRVRWSLALLSLSGSAAVGILYAWRPAGAEFRIHALNRVPRPRIPGAPGLNRIPGQYSHQGRYQPL